MLREVCCKSVFPHTEWFHSILSFRAESTVDIYNRVSIQRVGNYNRIFTKVSSTTVIQILRVGWSWRYEVGGANSLPSCHYNTAGNNKMAPVQSNLKSKKTIHKCTDMIGDTETPDDRNEECWTTNITSAAICPLTCSRSLIKVKRFLYVIL